ncbi:DUF2071 domain-containing protein [Leptospira sp. GIMC2001]|uniref:DUF2071 domain-containing protein n=1 Tax=Leptospira sp. GIMC2001 TaxID=1513297 RepID=UPI00234B8A16|nr:DUF2071 domain-containing protein [Leptospira sp. GIMC2001]WCL48866.1 DUF2071 domain-containing protein [Leptospira sp. GIMC2001]
MLDFLKNHPFPIAADFDHSIVLTFAIPLEELEPFVPKPLTIDSYQNKYGFLAIAMVKTRNLRYKGLPRFMGNDFYLIGYRIFVKYKNLEAKNRRGLYILKSETNRKKMEFLGNIFTHYNYSTRDIQESQYTKSWSDTSHHHDLQLRSKVDKSIEIRSLQSQFHIIIYKTKDDMVELPKNSPFPNWQEARKFAGPMPFTFSMIPNSRKIVIIEGVRENWKPKPIHVERYDIDFLTQKQFKSSVLANAFIIEDVSYHWKKGIVETW